MIARKAPAGGGKLSKSKAGRKPMRRIDRSTHGYDWTPPSSS